MILVTMLKELGTNNTPALGAIGISKNELDGTQCFSEYIHKDKQMSMEPMKYRIRLCAASSRARGS